MHLQFCTVQVFTYLGFTTTKNHHQSGPRQHSTIADLSRNNTAQHNTILEKWWMMIWFWFVKIQKNVNESNPSKKNPIERMVHGGDRDFPTNDDCSIFPQINHENLSISKQNEQHQLSPPSSSSSLSSPSSSSPPLNPFSCHPHRPIPLLPWTHNQVRRRSIPK